MIFSTQDSLLISLIQLKLSLLISPENCFSDSFVNFRFRFFMQLSQISAQSFDLGDFLKTSFEVLAKNFSWPLSFCFFESSLCLCLLLATLFYLWKIWWFSLVSNKKSKSHERIKIYDNLIIIFTRFSFDQSSCWLWIKHHNHGWEDSIR